MAMAAVICLYYIVFNILTVKELNQYYFPAYGLVLATGLINSLSLVFSISGKRTFLKTAGIISVILGVILLVTWYGFQYTGNMPLKITLEKVHSWAGWINVIIPVFFILNLFQESKLAGKKNSTKTSDKVLSGLMSATVIIALIFTVYLGQRITRQSIVAVVPHGVTERDKGMAKPYEARYFISSKGDTLHYRLMKPMNYDPAKKYPLVLLLHHGGAHGSDNVSQIGGSDAPFFYNYLNREKYPAFLFVPQCPEATGWWEPSVDLSIMETIEALEKEFSTDVRRRYVMGTSGGGYGSWHFIGTHPKMFAAAIPICGAGDTGSAKNMVDVAIWAFHGEKDELVPVSSSRDMIAAIRKAGGNPKYTEFPDTGHNLGKEVQSTKGLLDWLFAQKRE